MKVSSFLYFLSVVDIDVLLLNTGLESTLLRELGIGYPSAQTATWLAAEKRWTKTPLPQSPNLKKGPLYKTCYLVVLYIEWSKPKHDGVWYRSTVVEQMGITSNKNPVRSWMQACWDLQTQGGSETQRAIPLHLILKRCSPQCSELWFMRSASCSTSPEEVQIMRQNTEKDAIKLH